MNLNSLLINKLLRNSYSKKIRNFLGIKPSSDIIDYTSNNMSVSDAFFWRTDNHFHTIFKLTNILKYFYKINDTNVKLIFFNKNNEFLKEFNLSLRKNSYEIIINKLFLNNIEDYGVFYVFHESKDKLNSIIRNSCYTGYSWKGNLPSMVHGNTITAKKKFNNSDIDYGLGGYSYFNKKIYKIQNYLISKKTEIMLINPTQKKISINVNGKNFTLKKGFSKLIDIEDDNLIKIKSNCYLLRPIIFENNNDYLNVYHG